MTAGAESLLRGDLLQLGPNVIGATGGSGTRAVARIARRGGLFIGTNLNESEDALEIAEYYDRWINAFVFAERNGLSGALDETMAADLSPVLETHCAEIAPAPGPWGWKEPRSVYLLSFFDRSFPSFRFLHVVRDGRDMAASANQNQLRKHGAAVLGPSPERMSRPAGSITLWSRVNLDAAQYGEERLGTRYLRLRFEDLCRDAVPTVARILDFLELAGDARELASEVSPPETFGRWRSLDSETRAQLERIGRSALVKFGYL